VTIFLDMGCKCVCDIQMEDLVCPLAWQYVMVGGAEPPVALGVFPAFICLWENASDRVICCRALVSQAAGWVHVVGEGIGDGIVAVQERAGHGSNMAEGVDREGVEEYIGVVQFLNDLVSRYLGFDDGATRISGFLNAVPVFILPALYGLVMTNDMGRDLI
jgi:hypothetical protein